MSEPTRHPSRRSWRPASLVAAGTLALAGCGTSASGVARNPSAQTPTSAAPVAPAPTATAPTAVAAVGIVNFAFTPAALTVKAGTTVVWTNKDSIGHTVNLTRAGINSAVLNQNDKFSHTFTAPGTYDYICSIHPFMHGSIAVTS